MAGGKLTHLEMEMLIRVCEYYWTPEMRHKIAKTLPAVYAKLTGTHVTVEAVGASVGVTIEPATPAPDIVPVKNPNKGAPWE